VTGSEESSIDEYGEALAHGIEEALPGWVMRSVEKVMVAWAGTFPVGVATASRVVGETAAADIGREVRRLLSTDIDEQWTTPLEIVRSAVKYPTVVLAELGVPPMRRDDFSARRFPEDTYGLSPASLADLDPSLAEIGVLWGAAKALGHRRRR
jgi:hypothetical protein